MNQARLISLVAALAIAATAGAAQAAKLDDKQKAAKAERLAQLHRVHKQPKTMAEAHQTQVRSADGTVSILVPVELWNQLSVTTDAQDKTIVVESEATVDAPAQEVSTHE